MSWTSSPVTTQYFQTCFLFWISAERPHISTLLDISRQPTLNAVSQQTVGRDVAAGEARLHPGLQQRLPLLGHRAGLEERDPGRLQHRGGATNLSGRELKLLTAFLFRSLFIIRSLTSSGQTSSSESSQTKTRTFLCQEISDLCLTEDWDVCREVNRAKAAEGFY